MDGPTDGQSNRWTDRQSGLERHVYVIKTSLDTRHLSWKEAFKHKLLTIQKSAGRTGGPTDLATHQGCAGAGREKEGPPTSPFGRAPLILIPTPHPRASPLYTYKGHFLT